MRREHDIGLFGRRLLRLIVASRRRTGSAPPCACRQCFLDLRADLERGLDRLEIAAHRLVGAELGAFAALPDRRGDAVRHLAARLVRQPVRRHGVRTRWGSPLLLASMTNRAIACLPSSDLPMPVVILMALWGGSLRSSGSSIFPDLVPGQRLRHDLIENAAQHLPAVICGRAARPPLADADACSGSVS